MAKKNEIAKAEATSIQPVEQIESLILTIRGKQVILDRDLARLYGVETRVLNQAVQRNIERFPEDFMFKLTKEEVEFLKSQIVILEMGEHKSSQNAITSDENLKSQIATLEKEDMRGKHVKFLPYAWYTPRPKAWSKPFWTSMPKRSSPSTMTSSLSPSTLGMNQTA